MHTPTTPTTPTDATVAELRRQLRHARKTAGQPTADVKYLTRDKLIDQLTHPAPHNPDPQPDPHTSRNHPDPQPQPDPEPNPQPDPQPEIEPTERARPGTIAQHISEAVTNAQTPLTATEIARTPTSHYPHPDKRPSIGAINNAIRAEAGDYTATSIDRGNRQPLAAAPTRQPEEVAP